MKVSVLIPAYNVEEFLPQCLDSVVNQTYKDLQIVLVDDGSKDATLAIAEKYANKDSRIEVYHQENKGVAAARNELLKQIGGDYFLFIDADDWIEPDMVEFLVSKMKEYDSDITVCGKVVNDAPVDNSYQEENWNQTTVILEFLRHQRFSGSLWNKLIRTSLLHGETFESGISYGEDALFCWHILQYVDSVYVSDRQMYHHCFNPDSISRRKWTAEERGSGHEVWKIIVSENLLLWPQFQNIAKARFAIEDAWALFFAAADECPRDDEIIKRQENVRKNISLIKSSGLASFKIVAMAWMTVFAYDFLRLVLKVTKV